MDFTLCFQIYGLFIFRCFFEKWTQSLKFGLLENVKFKIKLYVRTAKTIVGVVGELNKS